MSKEIQDAQKFLETIGEEGNPETFLKNVAAAQATPESALMKEPEKAPAKDEHSSEDTTPEEEPAPEPEAESANKVDTAELAKSTQALRRYGMTAAMIDKLSPSEVIEAGSKLSKIQADNDKAQSELLALKKPESNTPAAPDTSKVTKKLAEFFGEDAVPALVEYINSHVAGPLQAKIDALEADNTRRVVDSAFEAAGRDYPSILTDDATRADVLKKAQQIAAGYDDARTCIADACRILDVPRAGKTKDEAAPKVRDRKSVV